MPCIQTTGAFNIKVQPATMATKDSQYESFFNKNTTNKKATTAMKNVLLRY
jgi:hypothetical protein